jgi:ABC-type amino acid transport substrate-binding protein
MRLRKRFLSKSIKLAITVSIPLSFLATTVFAVEVEDIRKRGVLRHLGITYAHFVRETHDGMDGLDVELMQLFAKHLGVRYELVRTTWSKAIGDLTGQIAHFDRDSVVITGKSDIKGDILANGFTILDWRKKVVNFSVPTFPTGVWLVARADSSIKPIVPSGDIKTDIKQVMALLRGRSVLTMKGTCLDPRLYNLDAAGADIRFYTKSENVNEIAPAMINGASEATLLDIPDAMVALQKWPGEIKIIGPVSEQQLMAAAVDTSSLTLLAEFNRFFESYWKDGAYEALVRKYYPSVFIYLGDFFNENF